MRQLFTLIIFLFCATTLSHAGVLKGYVYDADGNNLPYTTIYVEETGNGTVTNEEAYYEIRLKPGTYNVRYQFMGYKTLNKVVEIRDGTTEVNVTLEPEAMVLREVEVRAGNEDPAYAIMRRAIAKAGYHLNQLDSFSAKVYIKGTGQVTNIPFLLRKQMEEEGIDTSRVFITESVNQISFKRPNTFSEKVLSIRSDGEDNNTSPNNYIFTSFYQPQVAKTITPFSPRAFAYYRFTYLGTVQDRGYEISKIKVTPRSRGDNVFEGYLYIVEDLWAIHSFKLKGTKLGIKFLITNVYAPIRERVWKPTTAKVEFEGKIMGFAFEYKYLASIRDYEIFINENLDYELEVIDEKTQPDKAEEVADNLKSEELEKLEELAATKEVTRKDLRKMVKEYEKVERKRQKEPDVVSRHYFKIDSNAFSMDSDYWADVRPIPLTQKEEQGYQKIDSLSSVEKAKEAGDTLKVSKKRKGFQPQDIILGDTYKIGDKAYFTIKNMLTRVNFNTVEGLALEYELKLSKTFNNVNYLSFTPTARYAFSRNAFSGKGVIHYGFGDHDRRSNLYLSGGRYISQLNDEDPIHPIINAAMTLLYERNYMKIFERDFIRLNYQKELRDKTNIGATVMFAERRQLFNNSDYRLINHDDIIAYSPNAPFNLELGDTGFPNHQAATFEVNGSFRPWLKYRIRNNKRYTIDNSSPTISFSYKTGKPIGDSDVDYDLLELGFRHSFFWGVRGKIDMKMTAGKFLSNDVMYFPDYKHFDGNLTPVTTADPVGSFRLLDYYLYSTNDEYFTGHLHYQFRKFLFTQIMEIRLMGIRENVLFNYLATPTSQNYFEVGYSLDYILRIFRLEAVASFQDGQYADFGVRIGIASNLDDLF